MLMNQKGASAVEFALVLPILILLLFGIIEFGLVLFDKAVITNASREGARAGIVFRYNVSTKAYVPLTTSDIQAVVSNYCSSHLITFGSPSTTITTTVNRTDVDGSGSITSGDLLDVTVSYPYTFLVLPSFVTSFTGTTTLTSQTVMRME